MYRIFWVILSVLLLSGCGYNDIQSSDEKVTASWAEVLNQYQRRADLVPNLVATVKGYTNHESEVLIQVTEARSKVVGATQQIDQKPDDPAALQQWQQAQAQLSGALSRLLVVNERYPELKADSLYKDLMVQLEGTENRIAVARGRYVEAVQHYNTQIRQFPGVLIAKIMGYSPKPSFQPENEAAIKQAPSVNFDNGAAQRP
ncbi:LemA family protein [Brenneria goodwinii]|uniref:LemA family protein n=1 Tax=Brenneria goodwinii TaxID=1109412 RepID=A0A0G4K0A9_9GAMM|nr:LemA family protein [Brenneria goodwinii]MCG8155822.1 LemA family protein [Brenneria goodwinii]MCG8160654.1 LemA family protein [Brenneria goodwinii]MCG8166908.1 LemA family protein [Brenneria goodwinii]MCG8172577.1 LemA family protein [Brenneria goodwinii]MCG8177359.1 LemA family protein [Brenneria goodwinii]